MTKHTMQTIAVIFFMLIPPRKITPAFYGVY